MIPHLLCFCFDSLHNAPIHNSIKPLSQGPDLVFWIFLCAFVPLRLVFGYGQRPRQVLVLWAG